MRTLLRTLLDHFLKVAIFSAHKDSRKCSNEFSLLWATSWHQFFIAKNRSVFYACFHVLCLVENLTASVLNQMLVLKFHNFELLLSWSVFFILHNRQNISLCICQLPNSNLFTFWHFWIKILLVLGFFFFGICSKTYFRTFWTIAQILITNLVFSNVIITVFKWWIF